MGKRNFFHSKLFYLKRRGLGSTCGSASRRREIKIRLSLIHSEGKGSLCKKKNECSRENNEEDKGLITVLASRTRGEMRRGGGNIRLRRKLGKQ